MIAIAGVVKLEMVRAARRQRGYFLRCIYAAFLLAQLASAFFLSHFPWDQSLPLSRLYSFFDGFLAQHYVLLAVLVPAMACGAVTEDKAHGTLQHLLTTRIAPGEIIVGKLLSQMLQLTYWLLVGLPVLLFFAGLARDIALPVAVIASSLALAFAIGALSMLMSVWCGTTREALLAVYLLMGTAALLVPSLTGTGGSPWLAHLNPVPVLSLFDLGLRWPRLGEFLVPWLSFGTACVFVASLLLRQVYQRQLQMTRRGQNSWWIVRYGRVRGNPVCWREQRAAWLAPLAGICLLPRSVGVLALMTASAGALGYLMLGPLDPPSNGWRIIFLGQWSKLFAALQPGAADAFFREGLAALLVLTLVVAIRASASVTGEKERGTWLALMLTTLSTREIILGKHRGIFAACVPYIAGHAAVTFPLALLLGFWATIYAVCSTLIMLLAVVLGSALGIWCSSRASSTWRSLLVTLMFFYLVMLPVFLSWVGEVVHVIGVFVVGTTPFGTIAPPGIVSWAICIGEAAAFWFLTHSLLGSVVARVGRKERWEMGFDNSAPRAHHRGEHQEKEQALFVDDIPEPPAVSKASASSRASARRVLEKLNSVTSREIYRGLSAEMRSDTHNAHRHFLAAAHTALALAEEHSANAQFALSLSRRKDAVSCFWRAGHAVRARLLLEELSQEGGFFSLDIDAIVAEFEQRYCGWGPY